MAEYAVTFLATIYDIWRARNEAVWNFQKRYTCTEDHSRYKVYSTQPNHHKVTNCLTVNAVVSSIKACEAWLFSTFFISFSTLEARGCKQFCIDQKN